MRPFVRSALLAALLVAAGPVCAQVDSREGIALQNQIYQLRQELRATQDQVARGGGVSRGPAYSPPPGGSDLLAQLLTRVESLEEQMRQLRGQIEETQNQLHRQNADLNKRLDDLAFQVTPQGGGSPSQFSPTPSRPGAAPAAPPQDRALLPTPPPPLPRPPGPRAPELAMQEGNAALTRHDYPAAEAAAREVLANRTSPRAYDAQLLLAQALAGERQHAQAAIAFDDAYNRARKGSHAEDALIGLANALAAINEKKAACDTLSRLRTEFPQPRPDIRDSEAAAKQKIGCG